MMQAGGWNPLAEMLLRGSMPPGTNNPPATETPKQQTNSDGKNEEEEIKKAVLAKFSNVDGFKEPMADLLTTGGIEIKKLPKKRLYEWLEFLKQDLDARCLGGLDGIDLAVLLWCLTGIRPNAGVHNFNCKTYGDLFIKSRKSMQLRANAGKISDHFSKKY